MIGKLNTAERGNVIDLDQVPYFAGDSEPLVIKAASGLERVRADDDDVAVTNYRAHRDPKPADASMRFGGIGLAAVMDVGAHPIRARLRNINLVMIMAITVVLAVAIVMFTTAATLQH